MHNDNFFSHLPGRRQFIRQSAMGAAGWFTLGVGKAGQEQNIPRIRPEKTLIIDAHCHAWSYWPYKPPVPDPETRGRVEQLINQMDLWGVDQATIVSAQIDNNPDNNRYVAEAHKKYPGRFHQYADVDSSWSKTYHTSGAAGRLESAISDLPIKGFTHYLAAEDDASWLFSPAGIDFFRVADERKLIASIACAPQHHPALRKVAERFPQLPILCHHLSGLDSTEKAPRHRLQQVLDSSRLPNMHLKFSGFAYVTGPDTKGEYPYTDTHWIYKACYERYGARMVWGSDYPVVNFFMTYQQSLDAFRKHCDFISAADRPLILGGTLKALLDAARPVQ